MVAQLLCSSLLLTGLAGVALASDDSDSDLPLETLYINLEPPLVTNYQHDRLRYLKAEINVKVLGQETADAIEQHKPAIRHELLLMLSEYDMNTLMVVGKRQAILDRSKQVIEGILEEEGTAAQVKEVLFVNFIVE